MVRSEVVGVVARRQLVSERGEGDDQVDGAPDGVAQGALGRPGICGGGEHVFAKLRPPSDGCAQNTRSPFDLALQSRKSSSHLHAILHARVGRDPAAR
jgi:hypothetical protein